jgi:hypothetical protein
VQLQNLAGLVLVAIQVVVLIVAIYAFVNAASQRADAYPAAGKMTKKAWMGITGGAVVLALVTNIIGLGITGIAITAVGVGIYLVDVRPKLLEVQGKSR